MNMREFQHTNILQDLDKILSKRHSGGSCFPHSCSQINIHCSSSYKETTCDKCFNEHFKYNS